ncbi:hypothetical protein HZC53_05695 [Candidatus Uhrbacteria bacterium]|nr:hypothetical protein [Candidatus Uhrbacteria bacterium]
MAKPVKFELSPKDLAWLEKLSAEIWEEHESEMRANLSGHTWRQKYRTEKRPLTRQEFKRLERLIRTHELPCLPGSGTFGFGFSLTVCGHSASPGVKPDALICVTGAQLPAALFPSANNDRGLVWSTFEPFTHSPRNRELLKLYGFEEPRERSHYEY